MEQRLSKGGSGQEIESGSQISSLVDSSSLKKQEEKTDLGCPDQLASPWAQRFLGTCETLDCWWQVSVWQHHLGPSKVAQAGGTNFGFAFLDGNWSHGRGQTVYREGRKEATGRVWGTRGSPGHKKKSEKKNLEKGSLNHRGNWDRNPPQQREPKKINQKCWILLKSQFRHMLHRRNSSDCPAGERISATSKCSPPAETDLGQTSKLSETRKYLLVLMWGLGE